MASIFDGFQNRATVLSFKDPITNEPKDFAVDASISIVTSMQAAITKYPVEGGGNVNDHIQPAPLKLNLEGVISESPSQKILTIASSIVSNAALSSGQFQGLSATFASAAIASLASASVSSLTGAEQGVSYTKLLSVRAENDPLYPKRAQLGLVKAFEAGVVFNIRTYFSDVIYQNMAIQSLRFTQNSQIGDSLKFTMSMEKITTVETFTRTKSELRMKDPAGSSAAEAANKGTATKKERPASQLSDLTGIGA